MAALLEIIRFAGLPAIIASFGFAIPHFWTTGGGSSIEGFAQSAMMAVMIAFMVLLIGAVIFQRLNTTFPARGALLSGASLALPVAIAFVGWVATGMKPETEAYVIGAIVLLICWIFLTPFAFCVIYLFPRLLGAIPLGR